MLDKESLADKMPDLEYSLLIGITAGISMILILMIGILCLLIVQGKKAKELAALTKAERRKRIAAKAKIGGRKEHGKSPEGTADENYLVPDPIHKHKSVPLGKPITVPDSPTISEHIYDDPDYDMAKNLKMQQAEHHYENAKAYKGTRRSTDSSENNYALSSNSSD